MKVWVALETNEKYNDIRGIKVFKTKEAAEAYDKGVLVYLTEMEVIE